MEIVNVADVPLERRHLTGVEGSLNRRLSASISILVHEDGSQTGPWLVLPSHSLSKTLCVGIDVPMVYVVFARRFPKLVHPRSGDSKHRPTFAIEDLRRIRMYREQSSLSPDPVKNERWGES